MDEALITQYIENVLQRDPRPGEVASWQAIIDNNVQTLEEVLQAIIDSAEAVNEVYPMVLTYQAIYGRVPDAGGLDYWTNVYRANLSLDDAATPTVNEALVEVLKAFVDPVKTPEFIDRYGANPTGDQFVQAAYFNVLNRTPDQAGLNYWQDRYAEIEASYAGSGMTQEQINVEVRAQILEQFVSSAEYKTAAGEEVDAFLTALANEDVIPVDQSLWDYTEIVAKTFDLTQGSDTGPAFVGTDADDTYNGAVEQTAFLPIQTLTDGDDLDGLEGRDTLNAGLVNLFTAPAGIHNIEVLNLSAPQALFGLGLFTPTLDLANADAVDTLGVRGFTNGVTINNLKTALTDINLQDIVANSLVLGAGNVTVNSVGTALDGADDSINLNAQNVSDLNGPVRVVLNNAGIETININSNGGVPNSFQVTGSGTAATTLVNIMGAADLTVNDTGGSAWNAATLEKIDATTLTGDLSTTVTGTGAVEVLGGEGQNDLTFGEDVDATAVGGSQDDTFRFASDGEVASFTALDSVNGAGGAGDVLEIEADQGPLLLTGVGANIVNTEIIRHVTIDPITGARDGVNNNSFSVDMSRSGSATTLVLAGLYDNRNVTVTNLTNADWVVYAPGLPGGGWDEDINDLTLMHANPIGLSDQINLRMDSQQTNGGENEFEDELIIDSGVELLNLDSVGLDGAGDNNIDDASNLDVDIIITGDHNLEIGVDDAAYDFAGGVVDAEAFTGDLEIRLGTGAQELVGGEGDDHITLRADSTVSGAEGAAFGEQDIVVLSAGGSDTVRFEQATNNDSGNFLTSYHHISGFDVADDIIEIDVSSIANDLEWTTGQNVSTGGFFSTVEILSVAAGTVRDAIVEPTSFLKFTTPINTNGDDAEDGFIEAVGSTGGGLLSPASGVLVTAGTQDVLASYYDETNSQMVLFTVDAQSSTYAPYDNYVDATDDIDVIGTIGMSYAEYLAFDGTNLAFV